MRVVTAGKTVNYRYDGLGRRVEKEITDVGVTTMKRYIYDNEDILLELDGSNNITARYTHGPGIDEPLIMEKGGASFFYQADGLGSITEITNSSGTVAQRYTYSSFGKIESQLDPNFIQPYTFTSREFDAETGLYFYRARYYDPATGRFLQVDPVKFAGGDTNLYGYVGNNPIRFIDPLGLLAFGFSIDLSTINPFTSTGGGTYGINLQYTSDAGWNIYVLSTPNNVQSVGFEVGLAGTVNFALGTGSWTGPFETYTGSYGFFQGGFFHTPLEDPNPGYFGVQFGGALGLPGIGGTRVNYQTLSDFLREFSEPQTVCK